MYHNIQNNKDQNIFNIWKTIKQLRSQKIEITRETTSILSRLGKLGYINDYMSIGDVGKTVLSFKDSFNLNGKIYIVNDQDAINLSDILIRGSEKKIGEFIKFDYEHPEKLVIIPSNSVDLITINQGLHHLPQLKLIAFLEEMIRILRPGGLFIIREHDAGKKTAQIPMLDAAHLIFNLLTDVKPQDEKREIRAFRSILEWREIVESVGFEDSLLYEVEVGDPTWDEMMCFIASGKSLLKNNKLSLQLENKNIIKKEPKINKLDLVLNFAKSFINDQAINLSNLSLKIEMVLNGQPIEGKIGKLLTFGQQYFLASLLHKFLNPIKDLLYSFQPLLDEFKVKESEFEDSIFFPEVILAIKYILDKNNNYQANPGEIAFLSLIMDVKNILENELLNNTDDKINKNHNDKTTKNGNNIKLEEENNKILKSKSIELIDQILEKNNNIGNFEFLLKNSGLSKKSQYLVEKRVNFSKKIYNSEEIINQVSVYLDKDSWNSFNLALKNLLDNDIPLFKVNNLENNDDPWYRIISSIFSSTLFNLSSSVVSLLNWSGLQQIAKIYPLTVL